MAFTLPEKLLLALLICASAAGFWIRFRRVADVLAAAKPDPDFHLGALGPRLRTFISEVLLQSKVIAQRPLAGIAHALVFWGFCAFALVTLNHLADGFGWRFLDRHSGWFGPAYFFLASLFAVAVALSITLLAVRRFVVRPKWLGEQVSLESGVIALLIFALMATYLDR